MPLSPAREFNPPHHRFLQSNTPMARSEPIKAVRGVRDILPAEMPLWRAAEQGAAEVGRRFGYEEIITPILEHAELIERVGEDTDAVAKELYRFDDRGGRNLALRPEATAGVVRAYFEGGLNQGPQPSRLICSVRCSVMTGHKRDATG